MTTPNQTEKAAAPAEASGQHPHTPWPESDRALAGVSEQRIKVASMVPGGLVALRLYETARKLAEAEEQSDFYQQTCVSLERKLALAVDAMVSIDADAIRHAKECECAHCEALERVRVAVETSQQ